MTTRQPDAHGSRRWDVRSVRRSRWFQPLTAIFLGTVLLAALSIGGHPQEGTFAFAIMIVFAIFLLVGDRSDTVRALRGDGRDERFELIQLRASTLAARFVLIAVVVLFLVEVARGNSALPTTG
jgi:hypothetical protein